jgi:hypothetical protein
MFCSPAVLYAFLMRRSLASCGFSSSGRVRKNLPVTELAKPLYTEIIKKEREVIGIMKKTPKKLQCRVCGLVVTVDKECGCEVCDLICCGQPLQAVKERGKK